MTKRRRRARTTRRAETVIQQRSVRYRTPSAFTAIPAGAALAEGRSYLRPREREAVKRQLQSTRAKVRRTEALVDRVQGRTLVSLKALPTLCTRRAARRGAIFAAGQSGKQHHGAYRRTLESKETCK